MIISFHWCNVTRWSASKVSCECKFIHCTQWPIRQVTYLGPQAWPLNKKSLPNESAFQRRTMYKCWTGIQVKIAMPFYWMQWQIWSRIRPIFFLVSMGCFFNHFHSSHLFPQHQKYTINSSSQFNHKRLIYLWHFYLFQLPVPHTHSGICLFAHLQLSVCRCTLKMQFIC